MKIVLDNSPVKLEIESPMGNITIEQFPSKMIRTIIAPTVGNLDYCARGNSQTVVDITPKQP